MWNCFYLMKNIFIGCRPRGRGWLVILHTGAAVGSAAIPNVSTRFAGDLFRGLDILRYSLFRLSSSSLVTE